MKTYCRNVLICGNYAEDGSQYCRECREAREHGEAVHSDLEPNKHKQYQQRLYERKHNHDRRAGQK